MGRVIIFTGKGGVGKTSVAASHAYAAASKGQKAILISADMAHNLGDIFEKSIGRNITNICENLDAVELDADFLIQENFPNIKKALSELFGTTGATISNMGSHFIIPGFENLFSLLKIKDIYDMDKYDIILVDCAPTAETLSLLKMPELLSWYMEKFFPVGKVAMRVLSPISKLKYKVKMPNKKALNDIEKMHQNLIELQDFLKNKDICSVRLVCTPEKMVVEETKRNFMYLNLYKYQVDGLFINRILPENIDNSFIKSLKNIQNKYLEELKSVFFNIPTAKIQWYPNEIRGIKAVKKLYEDVLVNIDDLFKIRMYTKNEEYISCDDGYILTVFLPISNNDNIQIFSHDMDINIKINNFNRCIPLPNILRQSKISDFKVENNELKIHFTNVDKISLKEI